MTTSVNQVRHLYVVNAEADFAAAKTKDGVPFFTMKDADENPVRSDLLTNVIKAKKTAATDMARKLKTVTVTATDAEMFAGQEYVIRVGYRKFVSQSAEDSYQELGSALCKKTGDDVEVVLKALAINLAANTKKQGMVKVTAVVGGAEKEISTLTNTDVVTSIVIREVEQPWKLGVVQVEAVDFTVTASPVYDSTNKIDVDWATITDATASETTSIGNGKKIADLEYFCLGDRGDIYRNMGWPNVIPTKYMVDPAKTYDVIDIHYAYVGANHSAQKSEKDITLVMPSDVEGLTAAVVSAIGSVGITVE